MAFAQSSSQYIFRCLHIDLVLCAPLVVWPQRLVVHRSSAYRVCQAEIPARRGLTPNNDDCGASDVCCGPAGTGIRRQPAHVAVRSSRLLFQTQFSTVIATGQPVLYRAVADTATCQLFRAFNSGFMCGIHAIQKNCEFCIWESIALNLVNRDCRECRRRATARALRLRPLVRPRIYMIRWVVWA